MSKVDRVIITKTYNFKTHLKVPSMKMSKQLIRIKRCISLGYHMSKYSFEDQLAAQISNVQRTARTRFLEA